MPRIVSVDDAFNLPAAVKVLDGNLPTRLGATQLTTTISSVVAAPKGLTGLIVGDSIAYGEGTTSRLTLGFGPRLKFHLERLTEMPVTIINEAAGGSTSGAQFQKLRDTIATHRPQFVIMMGTVNDNRIDTPANWLKETVNNVRKMIAISRIYGAMPVIMTNTPINPTNWPGVYDATSETGRQATQAALRTLATEQGVLLADVEETFKNALDFPGKYTTDGVHPGDIGADGYGLTVANKIAAQVFQYLTAPIVARDTFTRADSTTVLGTTETGSKTWSALSGTWGISTNRAYLAAGGNAFAAIDRGAADMEVEANILIGSGSIGILARTVDASNTLGLYYQTGSLRFGKWDAGAVQGLVAHTVTLAVGSTHNFRLKLKGNVATFWLNGTQIGTHTLAAANVTKYGAATRAGMYQQSASTGGGAFLEWMVSEAL